MKKGFTLIELIVYISLLSLLSLGVLSMCMSSVYFSFDIHSFSVSDYELLYKNMHEYTL